MEGAPPVEAPVANPEAATQTAEGATAGYDQTAYADPNQYAEAWAAYYAAYGYPNYYGTAGYTGTKTQFLGLAHNLGYEQQQQPEQAAYEQQQQHDSMSNFVGQPSHTVWVGGLPIGTSEQELRNLFAPYGCIEHIKLLHEKNCAFVRYSEIIEALEAHNKMQGRFIGGQQLRLGWGKPDERDEGPPPCKNLWLGNIGTLNGLFS